MAADKKKKPRSSAGKKKGGNDFPFFLKAMALGCAFFVIAFSLAAALLLSPPPPLAPPEPMTREDVQMQSQVLGQLMREIWQRNPPEQSGFSLSDPEVTSLLRGWDHGAALAGLFGFSVPPPRTYQLQYHSGRWQGCYPLQVLPKSFFGGCLLLYAEFTPVKMEKEITVSVHRFRAGRLPLPAALAEAAVQMLLKQSAHDEYRKELDNALNSVYYDKEKGTLEILYRPAALRKRIRF